MLTVQEVDRLGRNLLEGLIVSLAVVHWIVIEHELGA